MTRFMCPRCGGEIDERTGACRRCGRAGGGNDHCAIRWGVLLAGQLLIALPLLLIVVLAALGH